MSTKLKVTEEYRKLKKVWNDKAMNGGMRDKENPLFLFQMSDTKLLRKILNGELDVK